MFGIKLKMSYAYHQKLNAQTKRTNRTLKKMLRMYAGHWQGTMGTIFIFGEICI
jgi:hypothetical protein